MITLTEGCFYRITQNDSHDSNWILQYKGMNDSFVMTGLFAAINDNGRTHHAGNETNTWGWMSDIASARLATPREIEWLKEVTMGNGKACIKDFTPEINNSYSLF